MNNMIDQNFPVKVVVKQSSVAEPVEGLMYAIHYIGEGVPVATIYCPKTSIWLTVDLGFVTPAEFIKNDKIKLNEGK